MSGKERFELLAYTKTTFRTPGYNFRKKGKLTYLVQPAGTVEEFFQEMGALTKPPTEEKAQKIHLAHGMKIVGPPLNL